MPSRSSRLLIYAHPLEAAPALDALQAEEVAPHHYLFDGGTLVICGVGPVHAAAATAAHLDRHDEVWNLGTAGALTDCPFGAIIEVGRVSPRLSPDGSPRAKAFAHQHQPPIVLGPGPHLLTTNTPIDRPDLRALLSTTYDLVDMEGFGVALAAQKAKKPVRLIKIISDPCSPPTPDQIAEASAVLALKAAALMAAA